jgi:ankyrin repeat protein
MQQEINDLWQNKTIDLETLEAIEKSRLNLVLNYQNKQTGDNLLIYAARSGNLNLIKLLNENSLYKNISFTNKDGKNALHQVLIKCV